jgi:uncharacterized membrane protein/predicted RNA-binding Zn-ribbon protein involved in translation (DUF1610 family)
MRVMPEMNLNIVEPERKCLKCGHVRRPDDGGPDYACPACGAVYAKLEALQREQAELEDRQSIETRNLERRAALQERFDREQAVREAAEGPRYAAAHAAYLLMVLPFAVTQALSIAIAYKMRRADEDSWLDEHFTWQIRTFWYLGGLALLAGASLLVGAASISSVAILRNAAHVEWTFKSLAAFVTICAVALMTAMYRIGKGWYRLSRRESP